MQASTEAWFEDQAAHVEAAQARLQAWSRRRQDDVSAAVETARKLAASRDLGALSHTYGDWFAGQMERARADVKDSCAAALHLAERGRKAVAAMAGGSQAAKAAGPHRASGDVRKHAAE